MNYNDTTTAKADNKSKNRKTNLSSFDPENTPLPRQ
jgi:hypothetical protein